MAENPKFDNSNMFKGVTVNNTNNHTDLDPNNNSEVLATQGNVINSLKTFWNNLRAKLKFAVTRDDTSSAVGSQYIPVYVDENGQVQQCNGLEKTVSSITDNNIDIGNISPIIGTTLYIKVSTNIDNSDKALKIGNKDVFYPTGVEVPAKIDATTNLLVVYNGESWILINRMNEVKASNKTSDTDAGDGGYSGLMTADDKAKLKTVAWGANNYTLPTASSENLGGVKSKNTGTTSGKDYDVQVNSDGTMKVNVPWTDTDTHWTANLKVGSSNSINNESTNGNQDTYIKIVENNTVSNSIKVVGSGDTTVSSDANGNLTISSPKVPSYSILKTDNTNSNNLSTIGYRVFGPGPTNANTNHYLAGDGTWVKGLLVPIPTSSDEGKYLKAGTNGSLSWVAINTTASSK